MIPGLSKEPLSVLWHTDNLYGTSAVPGLLSWSASDCSTVPPSVWHLVPIGSVRSCSVYCCPNCCCFLQELQFYLFESECNTLQLYFSGSDFACRWVILCLCYCFGWSELSSVNLHDSSNCLNYQKLLWFKIPQNSTENMFYTYCIFLYFYFEPWLQIFCSSHVLSGTFSYLLSWIPLRGNLGKNSFIPWLWMLLIKVLRSPFFNVSWNVTLMYFVVM